MTIECYETEMVEIFEQESIDYWSKNQQFIADSALKLQNIDKNLAQNKIPLITHQIYLTSFSSPKNMDLISLKKTITSLKLLNKESNQFKHFIWTNDINFIPEEIKSILGVEIHLIKELENAILWKELNEIIDKGSFAKASDLIRYNALDIFGGIYRDLDYEIYKPEEFINLAKYFNFFGGKEFDFEPVYMGSALIGAVPNHPVIKTALSLLERNLASFNVSSLTRNYESEIGDLNNMALEIPGLRSLRQLARDDADNIQKKNSNLPEYLQYPCDKINKQLYETGPAVITIAFYQSSNQLGYNDILLPANILFNWEYAKFSTPDSSCHKPGMNLTLPKETIGADMFCGNWHKNNEKFYYPKNVNAYLYFAAQDGDLQSAIKAIKNGADVNNIYKTGATALYIASNKGHLAIVDLLIKNHADPEIIWEKDGSTPLYTAISQEHIDIIKRLIKAGASIWARKKDGTSIFKRAESTANPEIINIIKDAVIFKNTPKAMNINCYGELNKEIFAQENINSELREDELKKDSSYKITHVDEFLATQNNPIPKISHQVYLTSANKPKFIDTISLNKTIVTINRLNQESSEWKHYFWTNNLGIIDGSIKALQNVEIRLIDEFNSSSLWKELNIMLENVDYDSRLFSGVSNLLRYLALQKFGGIYRDLDYEVYAAEKLAELMNAFNFLGGKEFEFENSFIGNAFIASVPNHPIMNKALSNVKRNLNLNSFDAIPEYLKFPCAKFNQRMFTSGPAMLTLATYDCANQEGNIDLVIHNKDIFFNTAYAHYSTPGSICSKPNETASLITYINGSKIDSIGADMFCGIGWKGYFEPIYYAKNIDEYLYFAAQDRDLETLETHIENGANVNAIYSTGATALYIASHRGHLEIVNLLIKNNANLELPWEKDGSTPLYAAISQDHPNIASKLIEHGASIWAQKLDGTSIFKLAEYKNNPDINKLILKAREKDLDKTEIACYQGDSSDIFTQEGIDYSQESKKFLHNITKPNNNPIPKITHQIYFTSKDSPKNMDNISINKTIVTINRLNEVSDSWQHIFWTNNIDIVPQDIYELDGITIRLINELETNALFKNLINALKQAELDKSIFAQASDIMRIMALQEYGGIYRDLDNEIYRAKELLNLTNFYNFFGGKERETEVSFIGNAFLAAIPHHPIIETSASLIKRNLEEKLTNLPNYFQYPCNKGAKIIYETGSPVITISYFKSANLNGNVDAVMNANIFYNVDYARYTTPGSRCFKPNNVISLSDDTIASDMFCGDWQTQELIHYSQNNEVYLYLAAQNENLEDVKKYLAAGANVNSIRVNGVPPISIAVQNNYPEIVNLLLVNNANTEVLGKGHTALYWAVQNGNIEITKMLLAAGANIEAKQDNQVNILYLAVYKRYPKIVKLLLDKEAKLTIEFKGISPEKLAEQNDYKEITQLFLDYRLFKFANIGDISNVMKLLDLGANINSAHKQNATSIYMAAKQGHTEIVRLLIEKGADVNKAIIGGDTPLYVASSEEHLEVMKLLLDAGADKDATIANGYSSLLIAAHFEKLEAVKLLLSYDVNIISDIDYTALNVQEFKQDKSPINKKIHKLIADQYIKSFDKRKFEVVVARYNEDISWLFKEYPNEKIIIYNKGPDNLGTLPSNIEVFPINNIGRESHTYLYHIIKNYYQLADKTLFIQGYPYEHPLFLPLERYKGNLESKCSNIVAKCSKRTLSAVSEDCENQINALNQTVAYNLVEFVHQYIDNNFSPDNLTASVNGAQFMVNKTKILANPIEYYQNLISSLKGVAPITGYYFERTWDLVFANNSNSFNDMQLSKASDDIECYLINHEQHRPLAFLQEGINYSLARKTVEEDAYYKMDHLGDYLKESNIPLISHQVYLNSITNPKLIDNVSLNKTIASIQRLNQENDSWKHLIWTNSIKIIPNSIKELAGVEVILIDDLKDGILWNELLDIIELKIYSAASDLVRYMALQKFGGIYRDLDYEIYKADKLIELLKAFNFIGGFEFDHPLALIGNSVIASTQNHSVINRAIDITKRNLDKSNSYPDYLKYPCTGFDKIIFETGPFALSLAYFQSANHNGFIDIIMPNKILYHDKYSQSSTPESRCYNPSLNASNINEINGKAYELIGADMSCGSWYNQHLAEIYYPKNVDIYLSRAADQGDLEQVKLNLDKGAYIDTLKQYGVTPLYFAAQNGHLEVVQYLLDNDADVAKTGINNAPPLSIALQNGHTEIVKLIEEQLSGNITIQGVNEDIMMEF